MIMNVQWLACWMRMRKRRRKTYKSNIREMYLVINVKESAIDLFATASTAKARLQCDLESE